MCAPSSAADAIRGNPSWTLSPVAPTINTGVEAKGKPTREKPSKPAELEPWVLFHHEVRGRFPCLDHLDRLLRLFPKRRAPPSPSGADPRHHPGIHRQDFQNHVGQLGVDPQLRAGQGGQHPHHRQHQQRPKLPGGAPETASSAGPGPPAEVHRRPPAGEPKSPAFRGRPEPEDARWGQQAARALGPFRRGPPGTSRATHGDPAPGPGHRHRGAEAEPPAERGGAPGPAGTSGRGHEGQDPAAGGGVPARSGTAGPTAPGQPQPRGAACPAQPAPLRRRPPAEAGAPGRKPPGPPQQPLDLRPGAVPVSTDWAHRSGMAGGRGRSIFMPALWPVPGEGGEHLGNHTP